MKLFFIVKLQHKIVLLSLAMVLIVLTIAGGLIIYSTAERVKNSTAERALSIAQVVAKVSFVQEGLLSDRPSDTLQPFAEQWRTATGAAFIVISNMEEIRLSHPLPEKIGTPMADLPRNPVLHGQEHIYTGQGSLDPSIRANVPVFHSRTGQQIGFVSVGFYLEEVNKLFLANLRQVLIALLAGLLFSTVGAAYLARNLNKATLGLEPYELATIVDSLREGVVAVDRNGTVKLVNRAAQELLELDDEGHRGQSVETILPYDKLEPVITSGTSFYDQEQRVGNHTIVASSVPIVVDRHIEGAVITFRDRTEVNSLAEELTGVHQFVDILRAQAHEFKNKLHTISGLIQLERYDEAIHFATDSNVNRHSLLSHLSGKIRDSVIFGLLLGKASYMREQGIDFFVDPDLNLEELPIHVTSGDVVLIIGNLLQNSVEALREADKKAIFVSITQTPANLSIIVENSGPWIDEELRPVIYNRGVTTKQGGTGLGLSLVADKLQLLRGSIEHTNLPLGGVQFAVSIPY